MRIALDRSVRAGLELERFKRRTLLEPYFYEGSATPVIDGAHGICLTLLNDISRISLISEHDYEAEFVGMSAIHPDKSVQIRLKGLL